jgi:hypothetical protein
MKYGRMSITVKAIIPSLFISGICVKKWVIQQRNRNTLKRYGEWGIKFNCHTS